MSSAPAESEFEEELEMLLCMFTDECKVHADDRHRLLISLDLGFVFEVQIPKKGYPQLRRPELSAIAGPNAVLCAQAERRARDAVNESTPPLGDEGFPVLASMVVACQRVVSEIMQELEVQEAARSEQAMTEDAAAAGDGAEKDVLLAPLSCVGSGIHIMQGQPIVDRKSKFLAHVAKVKSVEEVDLVVAALRSNKHIASAAHPAIVAYRFYGVNGVLHQDSDDDGETGAAKKVLFLLEQLKVEALVVVTRWFGGILLGPDRFKHIMGCAKQALLEHRLAS